MVNIPTDRTVTPDEIHPGADLAGADLAGTDLSGADLSGADVEEALLSHAAPGVLPCRASSSPGGTFRTPTSRRRLSDATQSDATFEKVTVAGATFTGADVESVASFSRR